MSVSSSLPVGSEPAGRTAAERSREQTRERLLAGARALFAELGLHHVTTHDIAGRAGVAAGTFYLHFSNKREIFREIAGETIAALRERLDEATRGHVGVEEAVRAHAEALISFAEENRDLGRILFSGDTDAAAVESDVLNELAATIAGNRRRRMISGEMPGLLDPDVLSQAIVGMLARVVAWWLENPDRVPRERVIETLTRIQLAGTHPA